MDVTDDGLNERSNERIHAGAVVCIVDVHGMRQYRSDVCERRRVGETMSLLWRCVKSFLRFFAMACDKKACNSCPYRKFFGKSGLNNSTDEYDGRGKPVSIE